ncbi:hypothetical protein QQX13_09080 [Demequina sp. SYSU T00068]|uniref:hypothetical protein n=1 Tax=Demequina lignilytica TaxID=3051663 RepID=UPI002610CFB6|nr:hypothetical protein [Demequina sp. SYSU T00068]MDN4490980.1 hypothetical protein [Demequina sp. SYSU T00068]
MGFVRFMSSTAGRWTRSLAGVALVVAAVSLGGAWLWLIAPGAVFILVGLLDVCLLAPLFRMPLAGRKVRDRVA